jgi:predicted deacylase
VSSRSDSRYLRGVIDPPLPARAGGYRGAGEIAARIASLAGHGARVAVAGRGGGGGDVVSVTIGDGPRATAIVAGLHPIEWIGVEVGLALLDRLAADPPTDRRVIALPLVNIDGYRAVERDLRAGRRRWRRRSPGRVDLNRNFPVHWRRRGWAGAEPGDQPEVAAVVGALRGAGVDRAVSLHSIGRKVLLPWGGRWARPARWRELHAAATAIAARMPERYGVTQVSRWLPGAFAHGLEVDWLHGELGALAVLVECSFGGVRRLDPTSWIDPFRWYNPPDPARQALAIARAIEPFVRGA